MLHLRQLVQRRQCVKTSTVTAITAATTITSFQRITLCRACLAFCWASLLLLRNICSLPRGGLTTQQIKSSVCRTLDHYFVQWRTTLLLFTTARTARFHQRKRYISLFNVICAIIFHRCGMSFALARLWRVVILSDKHP